MSREIRLSVAFVKVANKTEGQLGSLCLARVLKVLHDHASSLLSVESCASVLKKVPSDCAWHLFVGV